MTEINFYVSKTQGLEPRIAIVYRLVQRALQRNLSIHIHTDSEITSTRLDDYLWSKEPTSFIPHGIVLIDTENNDKKSDIDIEDKKSENKEFQVNISHEIEPLTHCDYLINISNKRPEFFSRFTKMAEILDNNEEIITAGRKRYSFYRDRGYTLEYYQL